MNLSYSITDFGVIRREGFFYADKTRFIPLLEDGQRGRRYVLFLRPRRFGKSTFLSMMEHYYDLAHKAEFEALFSGLHVGANPTSERNRFLVFKLDFSGLGLMDGVDVLRAEMLTTIKVRVADFFEKYAEQLPGRLERWHTLTPELHSPAAAMGSFLDLLRRASHPLYIFIDEYDKLVNDLIARGNHDAYKQVLAASGFIRLLYERIKIATDGVVRRVFMTGVSPVMLNDMASGFNIVKNLSLAEEYQDLCGFSQAEVETLVDGILKSGSYTLSREQILEDLRRYYNGYRFSTRCIERLYNPNAVLNFLADLSPPDRYPDHLLDLNLRTDHQNLYTLLFTREHTPRQGPMDQVRTLLTGGSVSGSLHELFPLEEAYDEHFFPSYLYYLGLVTITGVERGQTQLGIPNMTIREIHGAILGYILEQAADINLNQQELTTCVNAMGFDGQLGPFLSLIDTQVIQKLSNRDLIRLDERALKMLMLAYLSMSDLFLPFSELEANRGYMDLILTLNRRSDAPYSFLIELKYIKTEQRTDKALRAEVEECFQDGEAQLRSYLQDQRLCALRGPGGWKAFTVVQVGSKALLYRELMHPTETLRWDAPRRTPKRRSKTQPKKSTRSRAG